MYCSVLDCVSLYEIHCLEYNPDNGRTIVVSSKFIYILHMSIYHKFMLSLTRIKYDPTFVDLCLSFDTTDGDIRVGNRSWVVYYPGLIYNLLNTYLSLNTVDPSAGSWNNPWVVKVLHILYLDPDLLDVSRIVYSTL